MAAASAARGYAMPAGRDLVHAARCLGAATASAGGRARQQARSYDRFSDAECRFLRRSTPLRGFGTGVGSGRCAPFPAWQTSAIDRLCRAMTVCCSRYICSISSARCTVGMSRSISSDTSAMSAASNRSTLREQIQRDAQRARHPSFVWLPRPTASRAEVFGSIRILRLPGHSP